MNLATGAGGSAQGATKPVPSKRNIHRESPKEVCTNVLCLPDWVRRPSSRDVYSKVN